MLALAPKSLPAPGPAGGTVFPAAAIRRGRVALLQGCAQQVLAPRINQAAINLLTRHGIEVVLVKDEQCCGALTHHLGLDGDALGRARANITAWLAEAERGGLDAILVTTSGCGTVIKDYGFLLREDRDFAAAAARVSALTKDITEYVSGIELQPTQQNRDIVVAYHSACSLQHGQKITQAPKELLSKNGFVVKDVPESHLCCGSAGTYNILQPDIANRLRDRKVANIGDRRVVDQDVEPAELTDRRVDHRLGLSLVADVAEHRHRLAAGALDLGDQRVEARPLRRLSTAHDLLPAVGHAGGTAIGDHDRGAVGGQRASDGLAAAVRLAASGDERHAPSHEPAPAVAGARFTPG